MPTELNEQQEIHNLVTNIKETFAEMNHKATMLGMYLGICREGALYRKFGNEVKFWNQFLDHIGMTVAEADKYIKLFDALTENGIPVPDISPSRLKKIIKYEPLSDMPHEQWIELAKNAPNKDFTDEINKIKGHKSYLECSHEKTETFQRCEVCHRWFKEGQEGQHTKTARHSLGTEGERT